MNQSFGISDLPKNANFIGNTVYLLKSDEFLAFYENINGIEKYIWLQEPDLPYIFESFQHAENFTKNYGKDSIVVLLFDLGDKYWFELPSCLH